MISQKEINISVFLNSSSLLKLLGELNSSPVNHADEDFPQIHIQRKAGLSHWLSGVLLSSNDFNQFIKPLILARNNIDIDFDSFIEKILQREGEKKRLFVASTFLERANKQDLLFLSRVFESLGFCVSFQIIIENLFDLLFKDFSSSLYQISTKFRFSSPEPFFESVFKNKIKNFLKGCLLLIEVFKRENISFFYQGNSDFYPGFKTPISNFYEKIKFKSLLQKTENEINPLFLEYLRCKEIESNINIYNEIASIKKISNQFKLKSPFSIRDLSDQSVLAIDSMSKSFLKLLLPNEEPLEKQIIINSETCNLKKIFSYISQRKES
jgi:hypothetical protein